LPGLYHLVTTNMSLHHIKDTKSLLDKLFGAVLPGGYLAAADLDPDGAFFMLATMECFIHGFDREALHGMFEGAGLDDVRDFPAAEMIKLIADGSTRRFSIFSNDRT